MKLSTHLTFDGIFDTKETQIASCSECGKRLLGLAREIHSHEFHSCYIVAEADGVQDEGKLRVALGMV